MIDKKNAKVHFETRIEHWKEQGLDEYEVTCKVADEYTNKTQLLYTKEEQDKLLDYWIHIILETKGGYWQFIELMQQPHSEFQHYSLRGQHSYEKNDVPITHAKRELHPEAFERYKQRFINKKEA